MNEPTRAELARAVVTAVATLVCLFAMANLFFWAMGQFGLENGFLLVWGGLIVLAVLGVAGLMLWYRFRPSASVRAP